MKVFSRLVRVRNFGGRGDGSFFLGASPRLVRSVGGDSRRAAPPQSNGRPVADVRLPTPGAPPGERLTSRCHSDHVRRWRTRGGIWLNRATEARFLGAEFTLSNVEGLLGMTSYPRK